MFKHVELMRKIAFRIMAKTFGAKSRDTNEALYDSYPLRDLVELLCFEDTDEARAACKHYNITVEEMNVRTPNDDRGSIEEIVFWRRSSFKEPKDKEKGFALPLRPKKMVKTIESKIDVMEILNTSLYKDKDDFWVTSTKNESKYAKEAEEAKKAGKWVPDACTARFDINSFVYRAR